MDSAAEKEKKTARRTAPKEVVIRGARVHNLKNIDLTVPLE